MSNPERAAHGLANHPEHARLLGQIIASWTMVEHQLGALCAFFMRAPPWHARTAYYAVVNANARIEMMRALLGELRIEKDTKHNMNVLLDEARTMAGIRNAYAHTLWHIKEGKPYLVEKINEPFALSQFRPIDTETMAHDLEIIRMFADKVAEATQRFSLKYPLQISGAEILHTSPRKRF